MATKINKDVGEAIDASDKFFVQVANCGDDQLRFVKTTKKEFRNLLVEQGVWAVEHIPSLASCTLVPRIDGPELLTYRASSPHSIIA